MIGAGCNPGLGVDWTSSQPSPSILVDRPQFQKNVIDGSFRFLVGLKLLIQKWDWDVNTFSQDSYLRMVHLRVFALLNNSQARECALDQCIVDCCHLDCSLSDGRSTAI